VLEEVLQQKEITFTVTERDRATGARMILAVSESLNPESLGGTRTISHIAVNTVCGADPACGAAPV
jgi:hypothetical protein